MHRCFAAIGNVAVRIDNLYEVDLKAPPLLRRQVETQPMACGDAEEFPAVSLTRAREFAHEIGLRLPAEKRADPLIISVLHAMINPLAEECENVVDGNETGSARPQEFWRLT